MRLLLVPSLAGLLLAAAVQPGLAQSAEPVPAAPGGAAKITASSFVSRATQSDLLEIESSRLAEKHAKSENVRQFAQQMVEDHTKSSAKLKDTLAKSKVQQPTSLDGTHKRKLEELQKTKEDGFDSAYMRMQVAAHEDAVKLFRNYSTNGDDSNLQAFAADTLPVLEAHLRHAKGMAPARSKKPAS